MTFCEPIATSDLIRRYIYNCLIKSYGYGWKAELLMPNIVLKHTISLHLIASPTILSALMRLWHQHRLQWMEEFPVWHQHRLQWTNFPSLSQEIWQQTPTRKPAAPGSWCAFLIFVSCHALSYRTQFSEWIFLVKDLLSRFLFRRRKAWSFSS